MGREMSLMGIHRARGLTFTWIDRKTTKLGPAFQSNQSSQCSFRSSRERRGGRPDGQKVSIKITADGSRWRGREIVDEKKQGEERILADHLDRLKRSDFRDFDKSGQRAYQKGKVEGIEQSKEESQLKYASRKQRDAIKSQKF